MLQWRSNEKKGDDWDLWETWDMWDTWKNKLENRGYAQLVRSGECLEV